MKPTVRIVQSRPPKRGRFIPEATYDYFHTPEGSPAINFRWQGFLLPGSKATFVFPRDVDQIGAAAARTSDIKGFSVVYQNPDGHLAVFLAVAPPEIVDEILSPAMRRDLRNFMTKIKERSRRI